VPILVALAILSFSHAIDLVAKPLLGGWLDVGASDVMGDIARRAAAAFAVSKSINAALSFVQEVTISGSIIVGGSLRPASFLDPINNLIDQFALAMLVAAAAALLIQVMLAIGAAWGFSIVLGGALLLFALRSAGAKRNWPWMRRVGQLAPATLTVALVMRLALPLAILLTGVVSDRFLVERYGAATAGLQQIQAEANEATSGAKATKEATSEAEATDLDAAEDSGWLPDSVARVTGPVKSAVVMVGISFGDLFQNVVTVIAVFVLETMLLPLTLVWLLYRGGLMLARPARPGASVAQ
jgi:hypothetical protein